jgi:hypothetical protein
MIYSEKCKCGANVDVTGKDWFDVINALRPFRDAHKRCVQSTEGIPATVYHAGCTCAGTGGCGGHQEVSRG